MVDEGGSADAELATTSVRDRFLGTGEHVSGSFTAQGPCKEYVRITRLHFDRQSQFIDPDFFPRVPSGQLPINKKTDYALAYNYNHPEISSLYQELEEAGGGHQISQMKHEHTASQAMLCGIEVKANTGSKEEAQLQLVTWLTAGLINIRKLRDLQKIVSSNDQMDTEDPASNAEKAGPEAAQDGEEDEILPMCGWIIVGDTWEFFMGFEHPDNHEKIVGLSLTKSFNQTSEPWLTTN